MLKKVGFTRWYDRNPELSQAVRLMEKAPFKMQLLISERIIDHVELDSLTRKKEHGLKELGSQKVTGLLKSKAKRRWYDEHPVVHKAFNYLYMMDDESRSDVGLKIVVYLKLLQKLAKEEPGSYGRFGMEEMSREIFNRRAGELASKITIYTNSQESLEDFGAEPAVKPQPEPIPSWPTGRITADMRYEEDLDGLKLRLGGLKYN